jgi:hypothetical protein
MPGNQKPRSRKHRGTQTGSISRARSSRPRSRQEAMAQARSRKSGGGKRRAPADRRDVPPSWRGAITRGIIFAALLFPVSILLKQDPAQAAILSVIAAGFYVPLGFYTERFFFRRRQQKLQRERAARSAEGTRRKDG